MEIMEILKEQQTICKDWIVNSNPVSREIESQYFSFLKTPMIKVIMGPRRCGKSFFSIYPLPLDKLVYINFDDERFFNFKANDLNKIYEAALRINPNPTYLIFDEIQNITGWELFLNRLKRKGLNIIVTGSNSKLLSKELATHLTGRTLTLELLPFSFREYLDYFKISPTTNFLPEHIATIKNKFELYLKNGGFPETFNNSASAEYLRELFSRIISKDLVERYQIRDVKSLRALAHIMMSYNSQELNYLKIKNSFSSLSINTLRRYIECLKETYLFSEIESYSTKIRERLTKSRKVYSLDTGMYNSLSDNPNRTLGRQLESLIYVELRRRRNQSIYFLRLNRFEIDFVITKKGKIEELIQVCWDFNIENTRNHELRTFAEAEKVLGKQKKTILTMDSEELIGDIKVLPVWKWLLE